MATTNNGTYEFEQFHLDVTEKILSRDGVTVPLTPKVFETLQILVQNAGHLLHKEELMSRLWHDRFVEESNLTFNIKMLRKALGDDAGQPTFIETIPKRGYRFIAEVRSDGRSVGNGHAAVDPNALPELDAPAERSANVQSGASWHSSGRNRYRAVIVVLLLIPTIAASGYFLSLRSDRRGADPTSIAVLPVRPIDPGASDPIFEFGIADSLINKISSTKGLLARPLNSIRRYSDLTIDPWEAGKEQKVDFVLASNYQLAGNKLRVTWHLLNVSTGQIEEMQISETDAGDLFAKQDAVAADIGNTLAGRFDTSLRLTEARRGTQNVDAYRLYLQGMYLYDRRTLEDAENALDKIDRATQLDPGYARAWAGKAHVHRSLGYFSVGRNTHNDYKKSIDAINHALGLDENLSDAHSALCENKFFYEYDFEGAERECKRAIELDQNSFLAHEIYSRCLWTLGRFDEAIKEVEISIDLQPTSLFSQRNYAISLFYARRTREAIQQFRRVSEVDQNFVANYAWFIPALLVGGEKDDAFAWFIKWQRLLNAAEGTIQTYEKAYRDAGWEGVGRERILHFDEAKVRSYFLEACLIAHTGNDEKVFEYLERSLERREWGIPFLRSDPSLDHIRHDPRFEDLAKRAENEQHRYR